MRFAVLACVILACGRIGFDPVGTPTGNDDATGSGDSDSTSGDGATLCMWKNCGGTMEACCVGGVTNCVAGGTCTGTVVPCDAISGMGCTLPNHCCVNGNTTICTPAGCI